MEPAEAFNVFAEGKTWLDLDDVVCAMIAVFGIKFKKRDVRTWFEEFVPTGASGMSATDFTKLVAARRRFLTEHDHARRLFAALDPCGRGYLELPSFREACACVCRPAASHARDIFYEMDRDKAGVVTFADFQAYLAGL